MSIPQYIRKISLIIGDESEALDLSNLRIRFSVRRGDTSTPNSADIRVYNVSSQTALKVDREYSRVRLEMGYEGNSGLIFQGTVKQVRRGRESQTDTYLDITAADGDAAYNFAFISTTLAAGATPRDQIDVCLKAMEPYGVTAGFIPGNVPDWQLPRGIAMFGQAKDYLTDISRTIGCAWSIQDGRLNLVPENGYMAGETILVNYETGMIGMPEQIQNGVSFKTLLNPNIKIGRMLQLNNLSIQEYRYGLSIAEQVDASIIEMRNTLAADGYYKVFNVSHYGDTAGTEWYSDVLCLSVDNTTPATNVAMVSSPGAIAGEGAVKYR